MFLTYRTYEVVLLEIGNISEPFQIELDLLINGTGKKNELEYIYALGDIGDQVLDLKIGESMYFQPNRDDSASKGIIVRIK